MIWERKSAMFEVGNVSRRMVGIYVILLVYVDFVTDARQNGVL